jgi:hypothetical protein
MFKVNVSATGQVKRRFRRQSRPRPIQRGRLQPGQLTPPTPLAPPTPLLFPVNPTTTHNLAHLAHSKPNKYFPKFAGYFRRFARLVLSGKWAARGCWRGFQQPSSRPTFFPGNCIKTGANPEKRASKSLILDNLTTNSNVFSGLEEMFEGTSRSFKST